MSTQFRSTLVAAALALCVTQAVAQRAIPNKVGLVVAVESTGYTGDASARHAQIIPGWSVEKARRMGASAIKLLVYYHPDASTAGEIEDFTSMIAADCKRHDLILMLEPLSYSLDENKKLTSDEKRYVVAETARRLLHSAEPAAGRRCLPSSRPR